MTDRTAAKNATLVNLTRVKAFLPERVVFSRLPSLRLAARLPAAARPLSPQPLAPALDQDGLDREAARWRRSLAASFAAMVVLPVLAAILYFGFLASNQYVSDLQFAVRGTVERLPGAETLGFGGLATLAALNSSQEAYAVADYVQSRSMVDDLARSMDLREFYGNDSVDFWSRLDPDAPAEALLAKWRRMVDVSVEAISGIVTVRVRAFTPEDAMRINQAVRERSETLVNDMVLRLRSDMVERAEREVSLARERLDGARARLSRFQNTQATLDPMEGALSLNQTITTLRRDLLAVQVELEGSIRATGAGSPTSRLLSVRQKGLAEEIVKLEAMLTGGAGGDRTAAGDLVTFDRLKIERMLAEQQVVLAERVLEQARSERDRRHIYIETIEGPTLPGTSLFPQRGYMILMVTLSALMIWSVLALGWAGVRDHAA